MSGTYSIVRPYPGELGGRVEALAASFGLTPALGQPPAAGTSDEQTARWLSRNVAQLLVVPFHFHRGFAEARLDGIGVLLSLPKSFDLQGRVLFMPVRAFSWSTSFRLRFEAFQEARPQLAEQLIVASEDDLDSPALQVRIKRALEVARGQRSRPPAPVSRRRPMKGSTERAHPFARDEAPTSRRTSGAWKFSIPPEPVAPTIPPISGMRAVGEPLHRPDKKKSNG